MPSETKTVLFVFHRGDLIQLIIRMPSWLITITNFFPPTSTACSCACIKWLQSMAPMTSVLSWFITTLTSSRRAHTYTHTHTHMHTHTHAHTRTPLHLDGFSSEIDLIEPKRDSCSTINDSHLCVSVRFAHGFTALRKPQNIHPDDGVK